MDMPNGEQNQQTPPVVQPQTPTPKASDQVGLRVSLIPVEELQRRDPGRGFRHFIIAVIVFVLVMGGVVGFLWFKVNASLQEVKKLDDQTAELNNQSKDLEASVKDAKAAQTRLRALGTLLDEHKTGLKIISFFEKHTLPDVAYTALSVSESGAVNLAAAASSFETYAAQINELAAQPEVKSVSASGLSPSYDTDNRLQGVSFNLNIVFDPSIFLIKEPAETPVK